MAFREKEIELEGERVSLRSVRLSDATKEYVSWMNNKEITQYLESRFRKYRAGDLRLYIKKMRSNPLVHFFAIIRKDTQKHIGNIKLGPIDTYHSVADIGIMIGDKQSWGKGFATEAILLIASFAFEKLKLHKISAGSYANNIGSIKSFLKAGFAEEGRRRAHARFKSSYVDLVLLAKWNEKYNHKN
ncbi:MAG: GNAT family N-acetyltransferase [Candidatus Wildermuthbacteria bacterium]|nr:GNAT family N-acetyltransferase [Candidatus Wildermuthbacteria bacterium]